MMLPTPALLRRRRAALVRLPLTALAATLLLGACGGPPKERLEEQQQQVAYAAHGYTPPAEPVSALAQQWRLGNDVYMLSLITGAVTAAPRPVIVYLPGLGETENAGLKWRQAWASAGYAVVSVQPLESDARAWASDLARSAEFKRLGQTHYAEARLRQRLMTVDALVAEARRLGQAGDMVWRNLDWSRTAVAGYELGAQAVMAIAGEPLSDGSTVTMRALQPKAAIVISPQVMEPPEASRYRSIHLPVLGITGPRDEDVLGLVQQPQWRAAPFEAMPEARAWLLSLDTVPHATLAGNETPSPDAKTSQRRSDGGDSGMGGGGGRRGGMGGMGGMGGGPGGMGGGMQMQPVPAQPDWKGLHEAQLGFIAAQETSLAFLDLQLKQAPEAREWFVSEISQAWIGRSGKLKTPLR